MPSLSDRLKALGVQVGEAGLTRQQKTMRYPIESVIDGSITETPLGESFLVESRFPNDHQHGKFPLQLTAPMHVVAEWARQPDIAGSESSAFVFLDTETTGLGGGTGTYAFMVGVGRFEPEGFRLAQFFMRDPIEEPALLSALESFLTSCQTVVTFNGKSFDVPLLNTRYITNGAPSPLKDLNQLDMLHLARRLWSPRLPSRALTYLEEHIVAHVRTQEDTPGWMIPQLYFDYLQSGDARPLKGVFYHNAMDILTLAALTNHAAAMLAAPLNGAIEHASDIVAIGRLFEDLGYLDQAARILDSGIEMGLQGSLHTSTIKHLAYLHRRRGDLTAALSLWWQAAAEREVYAHIELAKYYEHKERNFAEAIRWTQAALAIIGQPGYPRYERLRWQAELEHRYARLQRKSSAIE